MSCRRWRDAFVSDEPALREALVDHASACPSCAATLADHDAVREAAAAWRAVDVMAPAGLESRIAGSIARATLDAAGPPPPPRSLVIPVRTLAALAAGLLILAGALVTLRWTSVLSPAGDLPRAVLEVEQAQREYARRIAALQAEAAPLVASAGDPGTDPHRASILMAYRGRLSELDAVITEVESFLDEHPGHTGGHTVLLAAYREKAQVLEQLLRSHPGEGPS